MTILALVMVGAFGFNLAGGMETPSGSYILFVVVFTGLLGAMIKASLGEPLLDNVPGADKTLLIYLAGTCGTVVAIAASRRLAPEKALLTGRLTFENSDRVVIGCIAGGVGLPLLLSNFFAFQNGGILSIVRQLNVALPLSVLIAVYQQVKRTGGRSSFSWPALAAWAYGTVFGLLAYSKEGIFTSSIAWVIAAGAARLRVTVLQLMVTIPAGLLAVAILVPYAQYGRVFRAETTADWHVAVNILAHPLETRKMEKEAEASGFELYHWYNHPQGILDRLTLVPIDSALIQKTDLTGTLGLTNVWLYFENIVPHFLFPGKPDVHTGNDYAHEIGMLAPDDHSTGISFSPYAEAYHLDGWRGVIFLLPAIQFLMFWVLELVVGGTSDGPWALFFIAAFGHLAAEGSLAFPVYIMSFGAEAIVATAFFMIYITPIFTSLLVGPQRSPPRPIRAAPPGQERVTPA